MTLRYTFAPFAIVLIVALACGRDNAAPKTPLGQMGASGTGAPAAGAPGEISGIARAALDSGNALYRAKKYADALTQYRLAAQHAPTDGAPYFGIYMVARIMNNTRLADSASIALRARGMEPPGGPHGTNEAGRK